MAQGWEYMVKKLEWLTNEDDIVGSLQGVGLEGWELVAVVPTAPATSDGADVLWAYFNRPKAAAPDELPDAGPRIRRP